MSITGSSSALPAVGMLAGMLLLGFAGVIVIMPSTSQSELPVPRAGAREFLSRRLQGFGYITTSKMPSSFDSSDSSSSGSSFEPSKSLESGSLESSEWNHVLPKVAQTVGGSMGWLTGSLLLQVLFGFVYQKYVTGPILEGGKLDEQLNENAGATDFTNSIFGCHNDRWVCIQGLCCPMVRIAHTNAVSGVCPFWESLWCWCCCAWLTINIGPFCLLMWWRMRLKTIMRVDENPVNDFCVTMLCPWLSICQMSSAVDNAMGYRVSGCCEYTPYSYGGNYPMADMEH